MRIIWKKPSECSCSSQTPPRTPTDSPASCATVRSKYIQQLKELRDYIQEL